MVGLVEQGVSLVEVGDCEHQPGALLGLYVRGGALNDGAELFLRQGQELGQKVLLCEFHQHGGTLGEESLPLLLEQVNQPFI